MRFDYGRVTFANTSRTRSATISLFLHVTDAHGWDAKWAALIEEPLGWRLGRDGPDAENLRQTGRSPVEYFENPIHLSPGQSRTANLAFLYDPADDEDAANVLNKWRSFKQHLIVSDLVSGMTVELNFPASYHGKE